MGHFKTIFLFTFSILQSQCKIMKEQSTHYYKNISPSQNITTGVRAHKLKKLAAIKSTQLKNIHNYYAMTNANLHPQINLAIVSDFYFPFVGGVETHIKEIASLLCFQINKLIVITHRRDHYEGLRNDHGFPVYYLNLPYNKSYMITYPTFILNFPQAKRILQQQSINLIHCHQTSSPLSLQFIFYAAVLQIRVVLTEHSLVGFKEMYQIHFNRITQLFAPLCDRVICVSKTTRNNFIVRSGIDPRKVVVIPNGVSMPGRHLINRSKRKTGANLIRIIVVGRMTYRRGTDLLIEILPQICRRHKNIEILIVGDGLKRGALEKSIELHELGNVVKMMGVVSDHDQLLALLEGCDIFLNTPLTESFGIALAEAAMMGLHCVSTNVGGIQEAIPEQLLSTSVPEPYHLTNTISLAIEKITQFATSQQRLKQQQFSQKQQKQCSFEYKWHDVATRTLQLYTIALLNPKPSRKQLAVKALQQFKILELFFLLIALLLWFPYSLQNTFQYFSNQNRKRKNV